MPLAGGVGSDHGLSRADLGRRRAGDDGRVDARRCLLYRRLRRVSLGYYRPQVAGDVVAEGDHHADEEVEVGPGGGDLDAGLDLDEVGRYAGDEGDAEKLVPGGGGALDE